MGKGIVPVNIAPYVSYHNIGFETLHEGTRDSTAEDILRHQFPPEGVY